MHFIWYDDARAESAPFCKIYKGQNRMKYSKLWKQVIIPAMISTSLIVSTALPALGEEEAPVEEVVQEAPAEASDAAPEETEEVYEEVEEYHSQYYYSEVDSNNWEKWPYGPAIEGQAAVLMDFDTGAILYEKEPDTRLYPASITKIMTTLIACEKDNLSDVIATPTEAVDYISDDSSQAYLTAGEKLTVEQMLMAVMLQSANDAAYAIAEHTAGSMKKFVEQMNGHAKEIGCTNTHFNNPHGLHAENHYTTARDMAKIMRKAWSNRTFRQFAGAITYTIPATKEFKEDRNYLNNHKMMKTEEREYEGVLGGKTGYTDQAGNTLVTVCERNGMTFVCVVLNSIGGAYDDTAALLDYGYFAFKHARVDQLVEKAPVVTLPFQRPLFADRKWPDVLVVDRPSYITVPKEANSYGVLTSEVKARPNAIGPDCTETRFYYYGTYVGSSVSKNIDVFKDLFSGLAAESSDASE